MPTALATSLPDDSPQSRAIQKAAQILITRPEPGASETAARITALGLIPVLAPVMSVHPLAARLPGHDDIAAILLTSGSAVAALPPEYRTLPLLAVGDATAARAHAAGFQLVSTAGGDATDLAALAIRNLRPNAGSLLLAVGRFQGHVVADDLRAAGFRVLRRAVYDTLQARMLPPVALAALRAGEIRAALFFSAETARHFVHLAQRARVTEAMRTVDAVSIGRPAAVALEALPWRRISVATRPNQDEMLTLLR